MKTKRIYITKTLLMVTALFCLWSIIATLAFVNLDKLTGILGISLFFLLMVCSFTCLFKWVEWCACILVIGVYAFANYSLDALSRSMLIKIGVVAAVFVLQTIFCKLYITYFNRLRQREFADKKVMRDLALFDPETNLEYWRFAMQTLDSEVTRARRYKNVLSLLLAQLPDDSTLSGDEIKLFRTQAATVMNNCIRKNIDTPFISETQIGVILPETPEEGASVVGWRFVNDLQKRTNVMLNVGISSFPNDAVDGSGLIQKANTAIKVSTSAGLIVARFGELGGQNSAINHDAIKQNEIKQPVPAPQQTEVNKTPVERQY